MASVTVPIAAAHAELAPSAAIWLRRFYADVDAQLADNSVVLSSTLLAAPQLQQVWHAALVNEQSFIDNTAKRFELLDALVR